MVVGDFEIRRCEPRDEAAVYRVCLETGDDGKDASHLFDDPLALGHIFVGPYMKLEPELAFVAEDALGVCGYVLAALDSKKFYHAYLTQWLPDIRKNHPEPAEDSSTWTRTQQAYHAYYHPEIFYPAPYDRYPSHLHIDLLPRAQGRGLGTKMMAVMLEKLTGKGSPGVHLGMATTNARAERFYKRLSFHELARVGDTLYLGKRLT